MHEHEHEHVGSTNARADERHGPGSARRSWIARTRRWVTPRSVLFAVLTVLLWASRFKLPAVDRGTDIDQSWRLALAAFRQDDLRAGVDYVFTYGPLGFLESAQYQPEQFWMRVLLWGGVFEFIAAAVLIAQARRFARGWEKLVYFALLSLTCVMPDAYWSLALTAAACEALEARKLVAVTSFAQLAMAGVLAMTKFALFPFAVCTVAATVVVRWWRGSRRSALITALAAVACLVVAWLSAGQRVGDLPTFVAWAFEVARGYPEGMSWPYPSAFLRIAAVSMLLGTCVLAARWFERPRSAERLTIATLVLAGLVLTYKASAARHGPNGPFYAYSGAAAWLCLRISEPATTAARSGGVLELAQRTLLASIAALGCFGLADVSGSPRALLDRVAGHYTGEWRARVEQFSKLSDERARLDLELLRQQRQFSLPRMVAEIGGEPVDMLGDQQTVLLRNPLNYRPRPVFQSYVAYTPKLVELNQRFYEGDSAPTYVIQELSGSDRHLPASGDSGALRALLRRYQPLFVERGFLLWKLHERAPVVTAEAPRRGSVVLGEWLELADANAECRVVSLDVRSSTRGKLRALAAQPAIVHLELRTDAGELRYRIVPGMVRGGVILDPVLRHQWDLARWSAGEKIPRLLALRVVVEPDELDCFEPLVALEITSHPELTPQRSPGAPERLVYAMFETAPSSTKLRNAASATRMDNQHVLSVLAPSELRFAVEPGEHSVRGEFGIDVPRDRWDESQGVRFTIGVGDAAPLFERALTPSVEPRDRGKQSFELAFTVDRPIDLWLRTDALRGGDATADVAYWTDVAIDAPRASEAPPAKPDAGGATEGKRKKRMEARRERRDAASDDE